MRSAVLCLFFAVSTVRAGEYAVLASGARMYADRHEIDSSKVRLYQGTEFVELNAWVVKDFEDAPAPAPPAPAALAQALQAPLVATAEQVKSAAELADAAADRYGLPRALVRSVMAAESGMVAGAVSPKGAIGLMQLMPETARDLGVDPYDPAQNVDGGTRYLRELLVRYDGGLRHALAAYNAGPGAVDKYKGIPPYSETINYIGRIERKLKQQQ